MQTPQTPGVYIHKDAKGKILYVGKARNLQARLRSYFTGLERHSPKTRALVEKIWEFEVILVDSENESLLLENNLIKHNKPPYNILLRDDKTYPYLKLTAQEQWPRLLLTRKRKEDGGIYFGPYSNTGDVYSLLGVVNRFFTLVKCTPNIFKNVSRPCNYYDIKRCLAPCKLAVEKKDYDKQIDTIAALLRGKSNEVVSLLKKEMLVFAENLEFEKAGEIRDQMIAIENLSAKQSVSLTPGFDADVIAVYWQDESASFYVSQLRDGRVVGGQSFWFGELQEISDIYEQYSSENADLQIKNRKEYLELKRKSTFLAFVFQYYQTREIPKWVVAPYGNEGLSQDQQRLVRAYLRSVSEQSANVDILWKTFLPAEIAVKNKSDKMLSDNFKALCKMAESNALNRFRDHLKVDEKSQKSMLALQEFLHLSALPRWIECYDISNFQGSENVASQVVFKDGKSEKKSYRKYIIKDVVGQDDFASLREVLRRRFKEENRELLPDLLLIDGGEPQVRETSLLMASLGLSHVSLVGIAKSRTKRDFKNVNVESSFERIVLPKMSGTYPDIKIEFETRILKVGSPEYSLLTQLRDEAHRTAITFHRKRRDKSSFKSKIGEIRGMSVARRRELFMAFGSIDDMKKASIEELQAKVKIPKSVLLKLLEFLNQMGEKASNE